MSNGKLLVISNRLPITVEKVGDSYKVNASSGGLVTALDSVLRKHGGIWMGWAGAETNEELANVIELASREHPYRLEAVPLTEQDVANFYQGFSNEIVWPLFHDLQSRCNFNPEYWSSYRTVNERFANRAAQFAKPGDLIWIHDYHFTLVAKYLRDRHLTNPIGFFQHIPFPPPDIFEKLPWRKQILEGMLSHDIVGFQTERDRRNFVACVRALLPEARVAEEATTYAGRTSRLSVFPISIDFHEFAHLAAQPQTERLTATIREEQAGRQIVLGVDRLDYTKGIIERLLAYRHLLNHHPEIHRRITLVQVVVPSRADIPKYREMKEEVERLISEINGKFSDAGWIPIVYLYRSLPREELVAHYRAADIALVTPLKDGMNLVAKEYCAAQVDHNGVLILSEFAGAACELNCGALMVNPNDQEAVADALLTAVRMPIGDRKQRMQGLRNALRDNDVYDWAEMFLEAGQETHPGKRRLFGAEPGDFFRTAAGVM
jgi:alpha,alpha-trehalose-phosphate synthase [UDP-forming]